MKIQEYCKNHILVFDGAMGTYFSKLHPFERQCVEKMNVIHPRWISQIHNEYIEAGAQAIKTNTFCCNRPYFQDETYCKESIYKACDIANAFDVFVFADIGPISSEYDAFEEMKWVVDRFLEKNIKYFIFETQSRIDGLNEIASYIHSKVEDAFLIVSFSVQSDGFSSSGIHIQDLISHTKNHFDVIGLNCGCGVSHMVSLLQSFEDISYVSPNAGYPTIVNNRTYYQVNPSYFALEMLKMRNYNIFMMGGCCGTTPDHIKELVNSLHSNYEVNEPIKKEIKHIDTIEDPSDFYKKLSNLQKVIAVELDPPSNWDLSKFMKGAWQLKEVADALTIADCPIGRARMDASLLACKVKRELNMDVLPHMTCRDRNLNATKALLLADYAQGIRDVLLITGDPIPSDSRDEVKTVYQFNSRKMAKYICSLEEKGMMSPFHLFGALNVNALNFDIQLKIAKEKIENGMVGFFTQPILSLEAFENLKRAKKELNAYILGGVIPVVSYRNAVFMENEINGIHVCKEIMDLYVNKNREQAQEIAIHVSSTIMKKIENYVDGFYLMTPFGRSELMVKIIDLYKKM
ncbi:bifunctional homocysteine S-methyltransferase/methylenetetrahydrofolate reductase [Floccifex sp.]|uniref:bifunctional homocysteine S-methyltransferase/methylenetetrahydrofolate reductase n=1 Tax=Floccifex sp. TaxID=2815810 RepID=UPI003F040E6B